MEAIAGGAGGEKLSEFRTFFLFICSGKGKKERIFFFQTYIKKMYERHTKGKIRLSAPGIGISKKILVDLQYSYCANCCNLVP